MCECGSSRTPGVGPFASGRALVEFVLNAHGGSVAVSTLPDGGLESPCQGCETVCTGDLCAELPDLRRRACRFTAARH